MTRSLAIALTWLAALRLTAADGVAQQTSRSQEPTAPFPYAVEEVAYQNPTDGVRLTGTLTIPPGRGPVPAVLLVSGAGAQDRDYEVFGHRPFLVLADHLSRHGVAVLRVDDRGAGGSGGDASRASVGLVVDDLRAGVDFLREHAGVDPERVGLVAHSEGGRIAPVAAGRIEDVGFLVLLAPAALPAKELAEAQTEAALEVSKSPGIRLQAALVGRLRELLRTQSDPRLAARSLFEGWDQWAESQPAEVASLLPRIRAQAGLPEQVNRLAEALGSPWNRELYELDPKPPLESLKIPVLAIYGELDRQAPAEPSVRALRAAWGNRDGATIRVLPGLNHFFQHATTGMIGEVAGIEESFAVEALDAVSSWIAGLAAR